MARSRRPVHLRASVGGVDVWGCGAESRVVAPARLELGPGRLQPARRVVEWEARRKVRRFEKTRGREPTAEERLRLWDEATVQTRDAKDETLGQDLHRGVAERRHRVGARPGQADRPEVMVGPWAAEISDSLADHVLATVEQHAVGVTDEQVTMLL